MKERRKLIEMCAEDGATMRAGVEGCYRHGVQLEEMNGMLAGMPNAADMDIVRLVLPPAPSSAYLHPSLPHTIL